jgi:hypothetical protein
MRQDDPGEGAFMTVAFKRALQAALPEGLGIHWVAIAVFAALPIVGVVNGPSYALLVFGLAAIRLLHQIVTKRRGVTVDRRLGLLGLSFVALCCLSALWSVNAAQSLRASLQIALILAASLVTIGTEEWADNAAHWIIKVLMVAMVVGAAAVSADMVTGYKLTLLHAAWYAPVQAHKYNRGLNYLVFITWPVLAYLVWQGRTRLAVAMAALVALPVLLGLSGSARTAALVGILVVALVRWAPRFGPRILGGAALLIPVGLPLALRALSGFRAGLAPHLPFSGVHRLEIWDYMTLRTFERPLLGWGFSTAKSLPVSPDEIKRYLYADGVGIYPHNQWVELWAGLGAAGIALGCIFLMMVLRRISRLPDQIRPFAYAGFASAMACSLFNYEISTDSWWAALAAASLLFSLLAKAMESTPARPAVVSPAR